MTYSILKLVHSWAVNESAKGELAYHKSLAELAVAVKRVMKFH